MAFLVYASAVLLVFIYQGEELASDIGHVMAAFARPVLLLAGTPVRQPTCADCELLPPGSRVVLGADTVALLWEIRPASSRSELLIRGAFVPGGAHKVPIDSAGVALVPRGRIGARDTSVLAIVSRDSAIAHGFRARGRLFTDAPDARAYTIFW